MVKEQKIVKQMKDKSGFGWNEDSHMLSIIFSNDFAEGVGARTAAQLERDIDDDYEDIRETIVGLDDNDGVEQIGDDEDFPKTPVQSSTNGIITNPFEKATSVMSSRKKKQILVDTVESIGIVVKEIGAAIIELRKPATNTHIQKVYKALKHIHVLTRSIFMRAYNEMIADVKY
ncbi:hypothetical protein AMTRI_Chr11g153020 [Amborella trichopoda]